MTNSRSEHPRQVEMTSERFSVLFERDLSEKLAPRHLDATQHCYRIMRIAAIP
jgi:hypothetical protein